MPLLKSDSTAATEQNFDEQRHGKEFKKTARKFGKKRAQKQMVAVVLSNKRKAAEKKRAKRKA